MKIFLHQITDQDTDLDFTQDEGWVSEAVSRVDEHMANEHLIDFETEVSSRAQSQSAGRASSDTLATQVPAQWKTRKINVHFNLRNVDEVIVVSGQIKTHIRLFCSRCALPYSYAAQPSFSALFCKDPAMAGIAHLHREGGKHEPLRPMGQNHGFARHMHDESLDDESSTGGTKDLDITYISNDFIDLAEVLTEQLRLQVPFQPLCRTECKGICQQCGADLNQGRCACAKLATAPAFSVLKDLKLNH